MKAKIEIFSNPYEVARIVAKRVVDVIKAKNEKGEFAVLCLPTGSTPIGVYRELITMHRAGEISFAKVKTFNLDEYYPMDPESIHSYHRFMRENFFNSVDILPENVHIPNGTLPREEVEAYCADYELKIKEAGGLDLALLGIGRTGHIGFNEPGSNLGHRTRMVLLDAKTRQDASSSFFGEKNVPYRAITMGVGTIFEAKQIILMATGENKAGIIYKTLEGKIENLSDVPAAYLRDHAGCSFVVDTPAATYLSQIKVPWEYDPTYQWDSFDKIKRAVLHVSYKTGKAICELSVADFNDNKLSSLVVAVKEEIDYICFKVFYDLIHRIGLFQSQGVELLPYGKDDKTLVFSPHPDDDVICMGGLIHKFVRSGVPCKTIYMTNGSVAVSDDIVLDHLRFAANSSVVPLYLPGGLTFSEVQKLLEVEKKENEVDHTVIQILKGNVRKSEAINAVEALGLKEQQTVFLDLPFYRTGEVKKKPITSEDVQIVYDLLVKEQPKHIYVAADLTDPHATHRMCYEAIRQAVARYRAEQSEKGRQPMKIWFYRGAWYEWDVSETSVFVPLSKAELDLKIFSIFKHQSQKDRPLYPGSDTREFWQRARDRNLATAKLLKQLGLPTFYAVEAFVIVEEMP